MYAVGVPFDENGVSMQEPYQIARDLGTKVNWVRTHLNWDLAAPVEHLHKGKRTSFFPQSEVDRIRKLFFSIPVAQVGWFTVNHLAKELGIHWGAAERLLGPYVGHFEKMFRDPRNNRVHLFYPPWVWRAITGQEHPAVVKFTTAFGQLP